MKKWYLSMSMLLLAGVMGGCGTSNSSNNSSQCGAMLTQNIWLESTTCIDGAYYEQYWTFDEDHKMFALPVANPELIYWTFNADRAFYNDERYAIKSSWECSDTSLSLHFDDGQWRESYRLGYHGFATYSYADEACYTTLEAIN